MNEWYSKVRSITSPKWALINASPLYGFITHPSTSSFFINKKLLVFIFLFNTYI